MDSHLFGEGKNKWETVCKAFSTVYDPEILTRKAFQYAALKSLRLKKGSLRVYQQKLGMNKTRWWGQVTTLQNKF